MLTIRLIKKRWQDASNYTERDVDFLLEENDWNDFGYYTTYHLHVTPKRAIYSNGSVYLGSVHIMKLGQGTGEHNLVRVNLKQEEIFSKLPQDFYSITFSIDVYKGLVRYLSEDEREEFIRAFRLILKEDDGYYAKVKDDVCFQTSLMRGGDMESYSLLRGRELLFQEGMQYNLREKLVTVKYANADAPLVLNFSAVKEIDSNSFPNGVIAFIGKNGSGKSTALYKLASLLYADPSARSRYMAKVGTIKPSNLGISQLMIFSYSPFDNFILPGEYVNSDLILWAKNIESREGRFVFCGLRDVKAEAEILLKEKKDKPVEQTSFRTRNICLKEQSKLAEESEAAYRLIDSVDEKRKEWRNLIQSMKESQYELYQMAQNLDFADFDADTSWGDVFQSLSTGYKFFFHSMLHIIAYCEENAMLLFDEPENHLQAPLLSFMMSEIRKILNKRKSVMLIATHSPIILQEILAKNIRIVRRVDENVTFVKPSIETFGESFGAISSEVFDLTTDRVQYFKVVDEVYRKLKCRKAESVQDAINAIDKILGGISSQTLQYVVSKYIRDNRE